MDHEKSKLIKITNELTYYCLKLGAEAIGIDLIYNPKISQLALQCNVDNITDDEVQQLKDWLEVPRRPDVEDYLWELAGENESAGELSLIGMLTDEVTVSYNQPQLRVTMTRNK